MYRWLRICAEYTLIYLKKTFSSTLNITILIHFQMWYNYNVISLSRQNPSTTSKLSREVPIERSYPKFFGKLLNTLIPWKIIQDYISFTREFLIDCCTDSAEVLNSLFGSKIQQKAYQLLFLPAILLISPIGILGTEYHWSEQMNWHNS